MTCRSSIASLVLALSISAPASAQSPKPSQLGSVMQQVNETTLTLQYMTGGTAAPNIYDNSGNQNIYTIGTVRNARAKVGSAC